jgi:tryptophanyl-tRNA synthetase
LFELIDSHLSGPREEYQHLIADPGHVEQVLLAGAEKARESAAKLMDKVRKNVGLVPLA